jgi:hypothetical protein
VIQFLQRLHERPAGWPRSVPDRLLARFFLGEPLPQFIAELEAV